MQYLACERRINKSAFGNTTCLFPLSSNSNWIEFYCLDLPTIETSSFRFLSEPCESKTVRLKYPFASQISLEIDVFTISLFWLELFNIAYLHCHQGWPGFTSRWYQGLARFMQLIFEMWTDGKLLQNMCWYQTYTWKNQQRCFLWENWSSTYILSFFTPFFISFFLSH